MIEQKKHIEQRKAYSKPYIEQVKLVSQESVLAACKFTAATDPGNIGGDNCVQNNCVTDNGPS